MARALQVKSIRKNKNLRGKTVLLRVDYNVPIANGKVKEDYKIVASLPTIRFLLRYQCRVIIMSHLGRPDLSSPQKTRKSLKDFSTKPISLSLSKMLGRKVSFVDDCVGKKVKLAVGKMKKGEILLLNNLRFHPEEKKNEENFAQELASIADIYVNDAFAVSHRTQASVEAIKKFIPAYAGLLLEQEVINLNKIINPKKPLIVVMGGAKIETKLPMLKKYSRLADKILIGGMLANIILKSKKVETGKSPVDDESLRIAKKLNTKKIILPVDVIVGDKSSGKIKASVRKLKDIKKGDYIFDIGPETIRLFSVFIHKAKTIVWNGPMGMFENNLFKQGTLGIAREVAFVSRGKAFGVAGGGETIEALKMTDCDGYVDWVSTGGGATLAYLGGEKMPGLKNIVK